MRIINRVWAINSWALGMLRLGICTFNTLTINSKITSNWKFSLWAIGDVHQCTACQQWKTATEMWFPNSSPGLTPSKALSLPLAPSDEKEGAAHPEVSKSCWHGWVRISHSTLRGSTLILRGVSLPGCLRPLAKTNQKPCPGELSSHGDINRTKGWTALVLCWLENMHNLKVESYDLLLEWIF